MPGTLGHAAILDGLATLALIMTFVMMSHKSLTPSIRAYAFQSAILAMIAFLVGLFTGNYHIWVSAGVTLVLKAFGIPAMFTYITDRIRVRRERESRIGIPTSLLAAGLLTILAYAATRSIGGASSATGTAALPASLAMVLIGLFIMVSRVKALTQTLGLLVMENGMFLAALSLTFGMPLVVELGIAFDVLMSAIIVGILVFHINRTFDTISTKPLEQLAE